MSKAMSIEKTVIDVTKMKPAGAGEKRNKFLLRAMLAIQKLPSDDWETLSRAIQDWYNAAVEADNAEQPLPDFPDVKAAAPEPDEEDAQPEDPEDDEGDDDEPAPEEEEEEVTTKTAAGKGAKKPAPKKPAPKKAPAIAAKSAKPNGKAPPAPAKKSAAPAPKKSAGASAGKKGPSMRRTLKMIVIKKPKTTTEELIEQLEKKGFKAPSKLTVTSIRADTRDTIKVLNEAGITGIEL